MFVSLKNCTQVDTFDGHNISFDHGCTIEVALESMLNTTDDDNRLSAGVEDDPLKMLHAQSSDVLGKEFDSIEEAEEYYHKYSYLKGFSMRNDDLRRNKKELIMNDKKNKWVVKEFVTEHSHNLTNSNMSTVHSLKSVRVKTSQVMDHMVDQADGYASVDHTKKDLHNRIDAERRTLFSDSDVDAIIGYMTAKSKLDIEFFYDYQLNKDGTLGNLFWADSMSHNDYRIFDDILCFNTTYKTNAYRMPLVIFVGTIETYSWILKTFLLAMHGKYPTSIVTNGDKAMRKAIKVEMSGSIHCLCSWHFQRNAHTNLGDTGFTRAFSHCMVAFMTESEFETKWHASIDKFGLHGNAWVTKMYAKHKHIQRSKSVNAYLNRFLSCWLKLHEFIRQIDRAMVRLHHTEMKDNFKNLNEHHILITHLELLEKHAAELYTRGIFQLVHDEIKEEAKLSICNFVDSVKSQTYTFRKFDGGNKTWNVSYNPTLSTLQCFRKPFEAAGIPCRHTFGVMKAQKMQHIPRTLLMTWWTMNAKKGAESEVFRWLSDRCSKMCYFASLTTNGYQKAKLAIDSLYTEMLSLMPSSSTGIGGYVPQRNERPPFHIKDPSAVTVKGSVRRTNKT
ncbi:hypothetical protein ACOSQ3_019326 [Xanthoceras sorbifolium]